MGFFKKKPDFFLFLLEQAQKAQEGLEALREFAEHPCEGCADRVKQLEKEGDEIRRILIEELNHTFATPIDREDIFQLSRALDDVLDYANSTVIELDIYHVQADEHIKRMISIMIKAAEELVRSIKHLKNYPKIANDHAVKAKKNENYMEKAYRQALSDLFKGEDPVYMLKMREIFRHLSNCADRGDEAANIILSIVMKAT